MKLRKIAAAAAALIVASQVAAVGVGAETYYKASNGYYYNTRAAAEAIGFTGVTVDSSTMTQAEIDAVIRYNPGSSNPTYTPTYTHYSSLTGRWYTSFNAALAASGNDQSKVSGGQVYTDTTYSSYYPFYSQVTGYYYHNYADALAASNGNSAYVVTTNGSYYTLANGYGYYSSYTNKWYSTYEAAVAASNGNSGYVTGGYYTGNINTSAYGWYSSYTGRWYSSYEDAVRASNGNSSYVTRRYYDSYYYNYYNDPASYYYNYYYYPYTYAYGYNGYYYGNDANYYSYMAWRNRNNSSTNNSVTVSDGVPYIKNYKKYNSWDTIAKLAREAKSNQSLIIVMNGAEVVPESVISAIKGRNVALRFMLSNGSYWTINGTNLTSAQQFDTYIEYNINFIPAKLKNKAKKGSVAQYQVGLTNSFASVGGKYSVTLPLPAERGSRLAKVYLYDKEGKKLRGVATSVIDTDGKLTFSVTEGGAYYIVVE